jgi:hypothetical protein
VVSGTVRSAGTKEAVPGAVVNLRGDGVYKTATDAQGVFQITVPQGKYLINIQCPGFKSSGRNIEVRDSTECGEILLTDAKAAMTSFSAFDAHE